VRTAGVSALASPDPFTPTMHVDRRSHESRILAARRPSTTHDGAVDGSRHVVVPGHGDAGLTAMLSSLMLSGTPATAAMAAANAVSTSPVGADGTQLDAALDDVVAPASPHHGPGPGSPRNRPRVRLGMDNSPPGPRSGPTRGTGWAASRRPSSPPSSSSWSAKDSSASTIRSPGCCRAARERRADHRATPWRRVTRSCSHPGAPLGTPTPATSSRAPWSKQSPAVPWPVSWTGASPRPCT
jgi:hypothetical protein